MGTEASARLVSFSLIILCLIFTLCQLGSGVTYQSTAQTLPDEEVSALDEIVWKLDLDTPMSSERSFCNESSYDGIDGITCDWTFQEGTICHITEIELRGKGLTGSIPKELANLTYLKTLDLSNNQLTGSIPANLGNLPSLNILKLYTNQLTGLIPASLGNMKFKVSNRTGRTCTRATYSMCKGSYSERSIGISFQLDLSYNQLNGSIPATLGNVAVSSAISDQNAYQLFKHKHYDRANVNSVFYLDLSSNQLTGAIPESLGKLTFASYMSLHDNGISGALPQTLGNLINLEYLHG